jgi:hypothetical protein
MECSKGKPLMSKFGLNVQDKRLLLYVTLSNSVENYHNLGQKYGHMTQAVDSDHSLPDLDLLHETKYRIILECFTMAFLPSRHTSNLAYQSRRA